MMIHFCGILFCLLALLPSPSSSSSLSQCHSCLAQCKLLPNGRPDPVKCDCAAEKSNSSSSESCFGGSCFAKLELFPEESVAIIQKGCVRGLPPGIDGCNFSGQTESVHCYCSGDFCNERAQLKDYVPPGLPVLDCCECAQEEQCPEERCLRSCRGNYCLIDFGGNEQGCGQGVPRLQNFLRIPHYLGGQQGQMICAHYQASAETVVNGCVCTEPSGTCNARNKTWQHQMGQVLARRVDDLNYCYSVHAKREEEEGLLGADEYRKAVTCEGHFCFASLSTREMAVEPDPGMPEESADGPVNFVGISKQRTELLAGCLKVDDDQKVSLGCTVEYDRNSTEPLSVHCICDSHLCNYFDLLAKAINGTDAGGQDQQQEGGASTKVHRDSLRELRQEMNGGGYRWPPSAVALLSLIALLPPPFGLIRFC